MRARLLGLETAFCLLLLASVEGCGSFRAGNVPSVSSWPLESVAEEKAISVVVSGKTIINGIEQEFSPPLLNLCRRQTVETYRASGLFSQVDGGVLDPDLRAEVTIVDQQVISVWVDLLALFTFMVTPSWHSDTWVMTTTLTNRAGHRLATVEQSEVITTVYHLFLLLGSPSHWPDRVIKATIEDLTRATLMDAHARGLV